MAAAGGDLKAAFTKFATKADGKEATGKDISRWCKDAGIFGKLCSSNNLDIAFSKAKKKPGLLTFNEVPALIQELAKTYKTDKKLASAEEAVAKITEKLSAAAPQAHGATKAVKAGGVDRLTDTKGYTGAHKERFGEDGKGKGKAGRENLVENKGYVGNYKGEGTYEEK